MYELMALGYLASQCGPQGCPLPPRQPITQGVMLPQQTFAPPQQHHPTGTVRVVPARVLPLGPVHRPGLLRRLFGRR